MQLHFVPSESTFLYFECLRCSLDAHDWPGATLYYPFSGDPIYAREVSLTSQIGTEERFGALLREKLEITTTLASLLKEGAPVHTLEPEHIAWAVAVRFFPDPDDERRLPSRLLSLSSHALLYELCKPFRQSNNLTWPLRELALSIACEQRADWQCPGALRRSAEECSKTFEFVYQSCNSKLVAHLSRRFSGQIRNPETVAEEAWVRVFTNHWSQRARRQFLGLSRISTFVIQVARFIALDEIKDSKRFFSIDDSETGLADFLVSNSPTATAPDPFQAVVSGVNQQMIQDCLARLTSKQRLIAEMAWLKGERSKDIAEALGISQPAISQHLSKARKAMRDCMAAKGFS